MDKAENCVRIITFNTWKGDGIYDWRLQLMARELYTLMPDILCLQESIRSEDLRIDTASYLAEFLNMKKVYSPARFKKRRVGDEEIGCHSGLAILSTYDIEKHWTDSLPTCQDDPDRKCFSALIKTPLGPFAVTNLHLTHLGNDFLRGEQLISALKQNYPLAELSTWICCGDFNLHMQSGMLATIEKSVELHLSDCYTKGNGTLPAPTLIHSDRTSIQDRIDYIFHVHKSASTDFQYSGGKVVLNEPDFEGCYPSDHFGVCVDIYNAEHSLNP